MFMRGHNLGSEGRFCFWLLTVAFTPCAAHANSSQQKHSSLPSLETRTCCICNKWTFKSQNIPPSSHKWVIEVIGTFGIWGPGHVTCHVWHVTTRDNTWQRVNRDTKSIFHPQANHPSASPLSCPSLSVLQTLCWLLQFPVLSPNCLILCLIEEARPRDSATQRWLIGLFSQIYEVLSTAVISGTLSPGISYIFMPCDLFRVLGIV